MNKVSVVIPTYNRARLLEEALQSAFAQSFQPYEIIVVDDGSTDDTEATALRLGEKVRYIRQKNAGPSAARNNGIRSANGDFIAFLDSDDLWPKDRLERQMAALEKHPDLDFLFGLEAKFTSEQQFEACEIQDQELRGILESLDCVIPDPFGLLIRENYIPTSSVLFRKSRFESVGPIDERLNQAEDYDFWFRFAAQGCRFGFVNAVLSFRRMHDGNLVNQFAKRTAATIEVLRRYENVSPNNHALLAKRIADLCYDLGSHLLYRRDFAGAHRYLRSAKPIGLRRLVWFVKFMATLPFASGPT
ncbi:MAG: glycosyltransferase family A protein [Nibricoccus sp.]